MFNVNDSDAILCYQGTNVLAPGTFLAPTRIMQPRLVGIGVQLEW